MARGFVRRFSAAGFGSGGPHSEAGGPDSGFVVAARYGQRVLLPRQRAPEHRSGVGVAADVGGFFRGDCAGSPADAARADGPGVPLVCGLPAGRASARSQQLNAGPSTLGRKAVSAGV